MMILNVFFVKHPNYQLVPYILIINVNILAIAFSINSYS
jgi:hypothetical protein